MNLEWLEAVKDFGLLGILPSAFWNLLPDTLIGKLSVEMLNQINDFAGLDVNFLNSLALGVPSQISALQISKLQDNTIISQLNYNWDETFLKVLSVVIYGVAADQSLIEVSVGDVVRIEMQLSGSVSLKDALEIPYLNLSNGQRAYYIEGAGTDVLTFEYVVGGWQNRDNVSVLSWGNADLKFMNDKGNDISLGLTTLLLTDAHVAVTGTNTIQALTELVVHGADKGINANELNAGVSVDVYLVGINVSVGDQIEILLDGNSINVLDDTDEIAHVKKILTQADIHTGSVTLLIPKGAGDSEISGLGDQGYKVLSAKIEHNGNVVAAGGNVGVYVDGVRPQLLYVEADFVGGLNLTHRSVSYTYTFDQSLSSLTVNDFTIENGVVNTVRVLNNVCVVDVTANLDVDGKLKLTLLENKVVDASDNKNQASVVEQFVVTKRIEDLGSRLNFLDTNTLFDVQKKQFGVSVRFSLTGLDVHVDDQVEILLNGKSLGNPVLTSIKEVDIDKGYIDVLIPEYSGWGEDGVKNLSSRIIDFTGNVSDASSPLSLTMNAQDFGFSNSNVLWAPALSGELTQEKINAGIDVMVDIANINLQLGEHIELMVNGDFEHRVSKVIDETDMNNQFAIIRVSKGSGLSVSGTTHIVARVVNSQSIAGGFGGNLIPSVTDITNWIAKINVLSNSIFNNVDIHFVQSIPPNLLSDAWLAKLANRWLSNTSEFVLAKDQFENLTGSQILEFLRVLHEDQNKGIILLCAFVNLLETSRIDVNIKSFLNALTDEQKDYLDDDVLNMISIHGRSAGFFSNLLFRPFATRTIGFELQTPEQLNVDINRRLDEIEVYLGTVGILGRERVNAEVQPFLEYLNQLNNHTLYPAMLRPNTLVHLINVFQQGITRMGDATGFADIAIYLGYLIRRVNLNIDDRKLVFEALSRLPAHWLARILEPIVATLTQAELGNLLQPWLNNTGLDLPTDLLNQLTDMQLEQLANQGFARILSRYIERAPVGVIVRYLVAGNNLREIALARVRTIGEPDLRMMIEQINDLPVHGDITQGAEQQIYLEIFNHLAPQLMSMRVIRNTLLRLMGAGNNNRINVDVLRIIPVIQLDIFLREDAPYLLELIGENIRLRAGEGDFALVLTAAQWGVLSEPTIDMIFATWLDMGRHIPIEVIN